MDECLFCRFIKRDLPSCIIYEDNETLTFLSLENHPLVIPKKHFKNIYELPDEAAAAIMKTATKVARATKAALQCDGINLVQSNGPAAGQEVFHFHLHIKPRYQNDTTVLSWDTETVDESARMDTKEKIAAFLN